MRNLKRWLLFGGIVLIPTVLMLSSFLRHPVLIWNVTSSLPTGVYYVEGAYDYGDIVAFDIPEHFKPLVQERQWIRTDAYLLKRVVGMEGDIICIVHNRIYLNGKHFGETRKTDSKGRVMPQLNGCQSVREGHLWLMLADNPLSLDSRYFGQVDQQTVHGKASLLF